MGIGTSKGAFFHDEFHEEAAPWMIHPKDDIDDNVIDPQLDPKSIQPLNNPIIPIALVEDRTNQSSKEKDNSMVDDQQLPAWDIGMDKDVFSALSKAAGSKELDEMERDSIVRLLQKGLGNKPIVVYDSRGKKPIKQ